MSELTGKTLGSYQVQEQIGQGGMATVYRAVQPSMDRTVAIKVLPAAMAQDSQFVARFQQEAKTIASLEHARILPVYDYGSEGPTTYLVMRYLDGGTLRERVLQEGQLSPASAASIIAQVCDGLAYAHRKSVIHRDITSNNIMFDEAGDAVITDFGMARLMEQSSHLTGSSIVGTPAYVSPEQGLGESVDQRTDIYALGIVLYEMLIGDVPYRASTPMAVVVKHINEPLPDPQAARPDLSDAVAAVIQAATAKDPADRFPSCEAFSAALAAAVAGEAAPSLKTTLVSSGTMQLPRQSLPKVRPYRWLLPVGIVAGLALMVLAGVLLWPLIGPGEDIPSFPPPQRIETQTSGALLSTAVPTPTVANPTAEPTIENTAANPTVTSTESPVENPTEQPPPPTVGLAPGQVDLPPLDKGLMSCDPPTGPRYARDYTADRPEDLAIFGPAPERFISETGDALLFAAMPTGQALPLLMNGALVSAVVEMGVTWPEGPAALILHFNDKPGGGSAYVFSIGTDGAYRITTPNSPPATAALADASLFDGVPHQLLFSALRGTLTLAVDGTVVVTTVDPNPLPPGNLLMRVEQSQLEVDWLGVCAEVAGAP